jgi:hypothetical protein
MDTQPQRTAPGTVSDADQATALLAALFIMAAIVLFGVLVARQRTGFGLSWDVITPADALSEMARNLSGEGCPAYLQRAQVSIDGQYATVVIDRLGTFEVQSHYLRFFSTRPISAPLEQTDCRFTPAVPERLIHASGPGHDAG